MDICLLTAMVNPDLPWPPRLVGEVLGTVRLPTILLSQFWRGSGSQGRMVHRCLTEKRYGHGVHSFLDHLASGVEPVLGFELVALLQVDPDVRVHLLHSLFSVLAGLYSMDWNIFDCYG